MAKCPVCNKMTGSGAFQCEQCLQWTHPKCGDFKKREVQKMGLEGKALSCNNCKTVGKSEITSYWLLLRERNRKNTIY